MRFIVLILCLTLTGDTFGSIFRNQPHQQWDNLIVQPLHNRDQTAKQRLIQQQGMKRHKSSQSQETKENTSGASSQTSEQANQNWNSPIYSADTSHAERLSRSQTIRSQNEQSLKSSHNTNQGFENIFDGAVSTLQHITQEDKQKIHQVFTTSQNNSKNRVYNATELLRNNNYGVEEHFVKTEDGYYLTIFRIQSKQNRQEALNRPVVLLVHGLLGSADDWLLMGPEKSLAYQMADAGFDVYLGNVRGSKYSRRHSSKNPAKSDYWQFSIDEIAAHDLPAMIDRALKISGQSKLYYVGHSQATTAFFAMASTSPEYRQKVIMMYALSPMVYMTHVRSPLLRLISPKSRYYNSVNNKLGHGEFKPNKNFIRGVGGKMCEKMISCEHICSNVNYVISGIDSTGTEQELVPVITKHRPAGASVRQLKQYGQTKARNQFRKYDYGKQRNMKIYGQRKPPQYNMTEVKVPVALYYSEEDWLAHPEDVQRLYQELPDVRDYYKVPEQHFSSMDFQYSKKAPSLINKKIVKTIVTIQKNNGHLAD